MTTNPHEPTAAAAADTERRRRIDEQLQAALDLDDPVERCRLLDRDCPGELRADVDRLLEACGKTDPMPPVARLRLEALYAMGQDPAAAAVEREPKSPWQTPGNGE